MLPKTYKNPINTDIRYAVTTLACVARVYRSPIDADIRYAVTTLACVTRFYKNLIDADISYANVMVACVSRARQVRNVSDKRQYAAVLPNLDNIWSPCV